jgi:putative sigma-54 modulation protein
MQLTITFRHHEPDEEIKEYARDKLGRLEKYLSASMDAQVILTQEKHRHKVEVLLKADGFSLTAQEETADFYSSIDAVVDNLERQLKKRKEKTHRHKGQNERLWEQTMEVLSLEMGEDDEEPRVFVSRNVYAKPMSLEEAVMQLKVSDDEFLVFTDSETQRINVLYRRKDGNFGLIEPATP